MLAPQEPIPSGNLRAVDWIIPVLTIFVLSIPVLGFGFVWDDYLFLNDAQTFRLDQLFPWHNPLDPFWRPVSRDIYFAFVEGLGSLGPVFGHLLNLAVLTISIYLLVSLASKMTGRRGGFVAGMVFASLGVVPFLVGWVSGIQDLFAMLFVLLAMRSRLRGQNIYSCAFAICALLSKETSVLFLPVIAWLPWVKGDGRHPALRDLVPYALIVLGWASIHPGIRGLMDGRWAATSSVYIGGVKLAGASIHTLRYVLTLFNLPQPDSPLAWPSRLILFLGFGLALCLVGTRLVYGHTAGSKHTPSWPAGRVTVAGLYMATAPVLFTSAVVRGWQPYYAALGGIGLALLAARFFATQRSGVIALVLGIFLVIGGSVRGQPLDQEMTTERNFRAAAIPLDELHRKFLALQPRLPEDARVVVSTQVRGIPGIYVHMYIVQALRQWYRNPSIQIVKPEVRRTRARPEYFFLVTPRLDVAAVDPQHFAIGPPSVPLDYSWGERAFREYALGLFASGDVDDAVHMLIGMPEINAPLENCHHRLAAALLIAAGRSGQADSLLGQLDALPRSYALENIAVFLAEPLSGTVIDRQLLEAFGISTDDRSAWLTLAKWSVTNGYPDAGLRSIDNLLAMGDRSAQVEDLARRLLHLRLKTERIPSEDKPPLKLD